MSRDKCTEIIFYWWDDFICLQARSRINEETREKYFLTYWRNGIGQSILHLREQIRKHGQPSKTYIDGLDTKCMTRWVKNQTEANQGGVYHGNIIYDALCQGDGWFRNETCTKFDHCKRLIQKYKFRRECHVYVWTNHIALELSNKEYYHFRPDLLKYKTVPEFVKRTPQAWSTSLQEDKNNLGEPTRIVGVGGLNEEKLKQEIALFKDKKVTWHTDEMNCCTFILDMLSEASHYYRKQTNKQGNVKINDLSHLVYKQQACTLYLWSGNTTVGKRMHLSLQLPNGEYISHYPDASKKQIVKNVIGGLPGKRYVSFKQEVSLKKPPDEVLTMLHIQFDIEKMTNYWYQLQDSEPDWNIGDKSCCHIVYDVLCRGSKSFCDRIKGIMKPYDVMQLAKAIEHDHAHMDESFVPIRFLLCLIAYCFRQVLLIYLCYNDL